MEEDLEKRLLQVETSLRKTEALYNQLLGQKQLIKSLIENENGEKEENERN